MQGIIHNLVVNLHCRVNHFSLSHQFRLKALPLSKFGRDDIGAGVFVSHRTKAKRTLWRYEEIREAIR